MIVAFYNSTYNDNYIPYDSELLIVKDIDILPANKSLIKIDNMFYLIECCKPIIFSTLNDEKVMCCWAKQIFNEEYCYDHSPKLERIYKTLLRKRKINDILDF